MGAVGSASGKLILFGEHAAVHGHPAIGISLPERTSIRFSGQGAGAWNLGRLCAADCGPVARVLEVLERATPGASRLRCTVEIESEVARGVGFGSSAALCAALARATLAGLAAPAETAGLMEAWQLAHEAERVFHGTPSGIDTGLALHQGMFAFAPRPPGLPFAQALSGPALHLVVAAVPRAESCAALVAAVGRRMREGHRPTRDAIDSLGAAARAAREALQDRGEGTSARIGALADQAMDSLRSLGLSIAALDALLASGRAHGALGGKLSGAGAGGAFFLVAQDAARAGKLADALREDAVRGGLVFVSPPRCIVAAGG